VALSGKSLGTPGLEQQPPPTELQSRRSVGSEGSPEQKHTSSAARKLKIKSLITCGDAFSPVSPSSHTHTHTLIQKINQWESSVWIQRTQAKLFCRFNTARFIYAPCFQPRGPPVAEHVLYFVGVENKIGIFSICIFYNLWIFRHFQRFSRVLYGINKCTLISSVWTAVCILKKVVAIVRRELQEGAVDSFDWSWFLLVLRVCTVFLLLCNCTCTLGSSPHPLPNDLIESYCLWE